MKKQKAVTRKTVKKKPALTAKPLRELGAKAKQIPGPFVGGTFGAWDDDGNYVPGASESPRNEVEGVPLPPDLEPAVKYFAKREFLQLEEALIRPPWTYSYSEDGEEESEEHYPGWKEADLTPDGWSWIEGSLRSCFRQGFYLALMRYADDLKHVPEAVALLEAKRRGAKKGGEARRKQAAPNHKAIRKRFRDMRKTTPKKTVRYLRVAEEFGMSDRQVARIVDGID